MERRLAAIMAADVVGYARLIRADEEGTIAALKALRADVVDPKLAEHHGRIVKLMGDGMLAEFGSVVDAVRAAVDMQRAVAKHNAGLPPDNRIEFRIGINLGDVIIDGDDIHGDGVNVAARLEALAEPGGICFSGMVHEGVRDRIDLSFEDMGEQAVKNIDRPVRVWRWVAGAPPPAVGPAGMDEASPLAGKPSIAVLPFDNMSGDPEQEYFSDGMAEDIITEISRFPELFVIARNSSFTYKGESIDIKQVGRELGARYVLEGSVRRGGNRVRITAQLIDAESGNHLWAERYDRDLEDIFAVQDEITTTIAGTLGASVGDAERSRALRKAPASLEVYDHELRAWAHALRFTKPAMDAARRECESALAIDPDYPPAHAILAAIQLVAAYSGWVDDPVAAMEQARELAGKAVALDSANDRAHSILGFAELWLGNHDRAIAENRRAIEISPNNADAHAYLGVSLNFAGRPEVGLTAIEMAKRLNPHQPSWYLHAEGRSYFMLERYEDVIRVGEGVVVEAPDFTMTFALLAASYAALGRAEEAAAQIEKIKQIAPAFTLGYVPKVSPYKNPEELAEFIGWLEKAGLPE